MQEPQNSSFNLWNSLVTNQLRPFSFSIQTILDKNLLSDRGVICIDNALFKGEVYLEPSERTESGEALREFNRYVKEDPRTEQVGINDK